MPAAYEFGATKEAGSAEVSSVHSIDIPVRSDGDPASSVEVSADRTDVRQGEELLPSRVELSSEDDVSDTVSDLISAKLDKSANVVGRARSNTEDYILDRAIRAKDKYAKAFESGAADDEVRDKISPIKFVDAKTRRETAQFQLQLARADAQRAHEGGDVAEINAKKQLAEQAEKDAKSAAALEYFVAKSTPEHSNEADPNTEASYDVMNVDDLRSLVNNAREVSDNTTMLNAQEAMINKMSLTELTDYLGEVEARRERETKTPDVSTVSNAETPRPTPKPETFKPVDTGAENTPINVNEKVVADDGAESSNHTDLNLAEKIDEVSSPAEVPTSNPETPKSDEAAPEDKSPNTENGGEAIGLADQLYKELDGIDAEIGDADLLPRDYAKLTGEYRNVMHRAQESSLLSESAKGDIIKRALTGLLSRGVVHNVRKLEPSPDIIPPSDESDVVSKKVEMLSPETPEVPVTPVSLEKDEAEEKDTDATNDSSIEHDEPSDEASIAERYIRTKTEAFDRLSNFRDDGDASDEDLDNLTRDINGMRLSEADKKYFINTAKTFASFNQQLKEHARTVKMMEATSASSVAPEKEKTAEKDDASTARDATQVFKNERRTRMGYYIRPDVKNGNGRDKKTVGIFASILSSLVGLFR